jgi:hypothetical protein
MALLQHAIKASDDALVFDNSATAPFVGGPRLVFRRTRAADDVEIRQFAPIPDWVGHYVLGPLRIDRVRAKK